MMTTRKIAFSRLDTVPGLGVGGCVFVCALVVASTYVFTFVCIRVCG